MLLVFFSVSNINSEVSENLQEDENCPIGEVEDRGYFIGPGCNDMYEIIISGTCECVQVASSDRECRLRDEQIIMKKYNEDTDDFDIDARIGRDDIEDHDDIDHIKYLTEANNEWLVEINVDQEGSDAGDGDEVILHIECKGDCVEEEKRNYQEDVIHYDRLSIKAFPNPTSSILNIDIQAPESNQAIIEIYNLMGGLIYKDSAYVLKGDYKREIQFPNDAPAGTYVVNVRVGSYTATQKVAVIKP